MLQVNGLKSVLPPSKSVVSVRDRSQERIIDQSIAKKVTARKSQISNVYMPDGETFDVQSLQMRHGQDMNVQADSLEFSLET